VRVADLRDARIVDDGWQYAAVPLLLGVPLLVLYAPVGLALLATGGAILAFFRDPPRHPPETGIVAPADGTVSVVREEEGRLRVGVFMNVDDVHVNRAPAPGTVKSVTHRPGAHEPAFSKESDRNERVDVDCGDYDVSLIAGWFARRITPYVETGDELERGDRIGHIAFGSRADVVMPEPVDESSLFVSEGDEVRAGETVLADRPNRLRNGDG
jgi:phosphatidylserine decarboxylase